MASARSKHGLPAIHRATTLTAQGHPLADGEGAAPNVDVDGNLIVSSTSSTTLPTWQDPTLKYGIMDTDETGPNYFGFQAADRSWYIQKQVVTGALSAFTYAVGASAYSTAWTGRAGLTYTDFATAF